MGKNDDGLLALIGFGAAALTIHQGQVISNHEQNLAQLTADNEWLRAFHQNWSPFAHQFNTRHETLRKYALDNTVHRLKSPTKEAFSEALRSYLFGNHIAAANLVGLTIERVIRNLTGDEKSSLFEIIDKLGKAGAIDSHLQLKLHVLRQIRNAHSHEVIIVQEIDLLNMFTAVKSLLILQDRNQDLPR
ncbi:MAG: DUF4145 domain-containing protein [Spirochaetota bacterium]